MAVHGRHLPVEKLRKEARRCLRCQKLEPGHLARDCDWDIDICGTCGQDHATRDCNTGKLHCINCNSDVHASWSRTCPAFVEATRKIQNADRLEQYRFFPLLDDLTTWDHMDAPDRDFLPTAPLAPPPHVDHPGSPPPTSWAEAVEDEHQHDAQWQTATRRDYRRRSPSRSRAQNDPPSRGANTIPVERTRPRTMSFRDNPAQRQTTLTREGGFAAGPSQARRLSESRPPPVRYDR